MPRGDRTGPLGEGPMTGRQLGYGAGYDSPGYTKGPGGGSQRGYFGRGAGFGHGYGRGFFRQGFDPRYFFENQERSQPERLQGDTDVASLKSEVRDIKDRLGKIMEHIESISSTKDEK